MTSDKNKSKKPDDDQPNGGPENSGDQVKGTDSAGNLGYNTFFVDSNYGQLQFTTRGFGNEMSDIVSDAGMNRCREETEAAANKLLDHLKSISTNDPRHAWLIDRIETLMKKVKWVNSHTTGIEKTKLTPPGVLYLGKGGAESSRLFKHEDRDMTLGTIAIKDISEYWRGFMYIRDLAICSRSRVPTQPAPAVYYETVPNAEFEMDVTNYLLQLTHPQNVDIAADTAFPYGLRELEAMASQDEPLEFLQHMAHMQKVLGEPPVKMTLEGMERMYAYVSLVATRDVEKGFISKEQAAQVVSNMYQRRSVIIELYKRKFKELKDVEIPSAFDDSRAALDSMFSAAKKVLTDDAIATLPEPDQSQLKHIKKLLQESSVAIASQHTRGRLDYIKQQPASVGVIAMSQPGNIDFKPCTPFVTTSLADIRRGLIILQPLHSSETWRLINAMLAMGDLQAMNGQDPNNLQQANLRANELRSLYVNPVMSLVSGGRLDDIVFEHAPDSFEGFLQLSHNSPAFVRTCRMFDQVVEPAFPQSKHEAYVRFYIYHKLLFMKTLNKIERQQGSMPSPEQVQAMWQQMNLMTHVDFLLFNREEFEKPPQRKPADRARTLDSVLDGMVTILHDEDAKPELGQLYKKAQIDLRDDPHGKTTVRRTLRLINELDTIGDFGPIVATLGAIPRVPPYDEFGIINPEHVEFDKCPKALSLWCKKTLDLITNTALPVRALQSANTHQAQKMLFTACVLCNRLLDKITQQHDHLHIGDIRLALMLGIYRNCRAHVPREAMEAIQWQPSDTQRFVARLTEFTNKNTEPAPRLGMSQQDLATIKMTHLTFFRLHDICMNESVEYVGAGAKNERRPAAIRERLLIRPHDNDDIIYLEQSGEASVYAYCSPLQQRWIIGRTIPDSQVAMVLNNGSQAQPIAFKGPVAHLELNGAVHDAAASSHMPVVLPESQVGSFAAHADRVRGRFEDLHEKMQQLVDLYPVIFRRKYLGPKIFVRDGETVYMLCHRAKEAQISAIFRNPVHRTLYEDLLLDDESVDLLFLGNHFDINTHTSADWIGIRLPAELKVLPACIESPYEQVMLPSAPRDGRKPFETSSSSTATANESESAEDLGDEEYIEDTAGRVNPVVELAQYVADENDLDVTFKPGKSDKNMYRFAKRVNGKVMVPKTGHYKGYLRARFTEQRTGRSIMVAICEMSKEGAYILYEDAPDDVFLEDKDAIQQRHGAVLIPFRGDMQWKEELERIVMGFFNDGRRYYSLGHVNPDRGIPAIYKSLPAAEEPKNLDNIMSPAERLALQGDLLKAAGHVYGEASESNALALTVSDFYKIKDEVDFSFRGKGGGKSGRSILQNFAVYFGMVGVTLRDSNDPMVDGARVESTMVKDIDRGLTLEKALEEMKRLAFGSKAMREKEASNWLPSPDDFPPRRGEVSAKTIYQTQEALRKNIERTKKQARKPRELSADVDARLKVETYGGEQGNPEKPLKAASILTDLAHGARRKIAAAINWIANGGQVKTDSET